MKKIILGSLILVGLVTGYAFAHGNGYHMNKGQGGNTMMQHHMMNGPDRGMGQGTGMSSGCQGKGWLYRGSNTASLNGEQHEKFLDATASLRKQMHMKRFELREATRNQDSTPAQLAEVEKEIIDLRAKIQEQAQALMSQE